jgi:two-component system cell cycle response regulator
MTARVLVVDDVLPNVKLLEAKLSREYFQVLTAMNGKDALAKVQADNPDIILLDVMMPEMDGFEVCRRLKQEPRTAHIPVVMVTALSELSDRVQGLEAGADDFLTKPVNDIALFARVRSLVRLKMTMDELRLREQTSSGFGVSQTTNAEFDAVPGRILLVEDREIHQRSLTQALVDRHQVSAVATGEEAVRQARDGGFELAIVSLGLKESDPLRLCSQFRSMEETRSVPLLILVDDSPDEMGRLVKGLEIGVNDYLIRPVDRNEMHARVRTQLRRRRYEERLRANYHLSMAMAVTDGLTGLYNRRYMESHLASLLSQARPDRPLSLMIIDIDHFKPINDTHGHAVGDEVLREFAGRIGRSIRGIDLAARYGGEEFVVIMPDTQLSAAASVAERLRLAIAEETFRISTHAAGLRVTASIGVAGPGGGADAMLKRADEALYEAKRSGRNRVVLQRPESPPAAVNG